MLFGPLRISRPGACSSSSAFRGGEHGAGRQGRGVEGGGSARAGRRCRAAGPQVRSCCESCGFCRAALVGGCDVKVTIRCPSRQRPCHGVIIVSEMPTASFALALPLRAACAACTPPRRTGPVVPCLFQEDCFWVTYDWSVREGLCAPLRRSCCVSEGMCAIACY